MGFFTPNVIDYAGELREELRKFVAARKKGQASRAIELEMKMRKYRVMAEKIQNPAHKKEADNAIKHIEKLYNDVLEAQRQGAISREKIKDLMHRIDRELT